MPSPPLVTYIFRSGRRQRMETAGTSPTEFFYGFQQLVRSGWNLQILEDADIGMAPPLPLASRVLNMASRFLARFPVGMSMALLRSGVRHKLNEGGILIATTTGIGLVIALGKMLGLLHRPVVLIGMGLMPVRPTRIQRLILPSLLRHLQVVVISRPDQANLQRFLPGQAVRYVPFGVDQAFWSPAPEAVDGDYVLAIGNDPHRDWEALVAAWDLDLPPLKIITHLPVPPAPPNVEVVEGDWRAQRFDDRQIRALYRGARFVVVPVRQTIQPSGQSVCLQAMACGKAVIMSDIDGLWDRDLMVHGKTVLLVPPGDARALGDAIRTLMADDRLQGRLEAEGRRVVEQHLNVDRMGSAMAELLEGIVA